MYGGCLTLLWFNMIFDDKVFPEGGKDRTIFREAKKIKDALNIEVLFVLFLMFINSSIIEQCSFFCTWNFVMICRETPCILLSLFFYFLSLFSISVLTSMKESTVFVFFFTTAVKSMSKSFINLHNFSILYSHFNFNVAGYFQVSLNRRWFAVIGWLLPWIYFATVEFSIGSWSTIIFRNNISYFDSKEVIILTMLSFLEVAFSWRGQFEPHTVSDFKKNEPNFLITL